MSKVLRDPGSYDQAKECAKCGQIFTRKHNRMSHSTWSRQRFCSPACGQAGKLRAPPADPRQAFDDRYIPEPNTGCWIWTAPLSTLGYGWFRCNGKRTQAHRFSLEIFKGPIPEGLFALHTCDNRWCVNPDHLYVGTALDNARDMVARGRHSNGRRKADAER